MPDASECLTLASSQWAPLENKSLRNYVGVDSCDLPGVIKRSGVLVCKVDGTRHEDNVLCSGDTLLAVDGVSIADDGTIPFREMERLAFSHLVSQRFLGDTVPPYFLSPPVVSTCFPGAIVAKKFVWKPIMPRCRQSHLCVTCPFLACSAA